MTRLTFNLFRLVMGQSIVGFAIVLAVANPMFADEPAARDLWLWPFSATSIWNHPIGDKADYVPANLPAAGHAGVDTQLLVRTSASFPERAVLDSPTWGPGRATGTTPLGFSLRVPDDWIVPDAGPDNPYGLTPNANFAFLLPDGESVLQGCKVCRPEAGGPIYMSEWMKYAGNRKPASVYGDGVTDNRGQGATSMSAFGGTIRLGELISKEPIRHAIKVNPFAARVCFYSDETQGYRWPAKRADSYAKEQYKGRDPNVVMGALLAIPPTVSADDLGLKTAAGRKLLFALQNYGAYFTEDAAWDTWDLIAERGVADEFESAYDMAMNSREWLDEVNRLMTAACVVTNNGPDRIGGGGQPLQPLAPPFESDE